MLQLIGLIVAVYAMARLLQVPFEHAAYEVVWQGMQHRTRSVCVCLVSGIGLLCLLSLTFVLVTWDPFTGMDPSEWGETLE